MAKSIIVQEYVEVPQGVAAVVQGKQVSIKGPLGELTRNFSHAPVSLRQEDNQLCVEVVWPDKKAEATVGTIRSHLRNMITGVTKGFTIKLKIVFAHFPMSIKVQNDLVVVENFFGERRPRRARIYGDVKITVVGDDVLVQGIDLESVTQTAANIQQSTQIKKKDPRVFLDGIYVYEKGEGM